MPQFEGYKRQNFFRVAAHSRIFFDKLLDAAAVEVAPRHRLTVQQDVLNPALQFGLEPIDVGDGESGFSALEDRLRDAVPEGLLENVLGGDAADFEIFRQAGSKFEQLMIEKRNAKLDGVSHCHLVCF